MMKWCQVRVFLATCAGVLIGNLLAHAAHIAPVNAVLPCGLAGWIGGNVLNAVIAERSEVACSPVIPANSEPQHFT